MAFPDHKKQFLKAVGFAPEEIAAVEETFDGMAARAKEQNLRSKEQGGGEEVAQETAAQSAPTEQPVTVTTAEDQLKQAQDFLVKAFEPIMSQVNARISTLESAITAMQQQQTVSNTPAASLAAKSITQQSGDHVLKGRLPDQTPKENNADKEGAPASNVTGVPFLDNLIALNQQSNNRQVGG